jgi:hypothetical protein
LDEHLDPALVSQRRDCIDRARSNTGCLVLPGEFKKGRYCRSITDVAKRNHRGVAVEVVSYSEVANERGNRTLSAQIPEPGGSTQPHVQVGKGADQETNVPSLPGAIDGGVA